MTDPYQKYELCHLNRRTERTARSGAHVDHADAVSLFSRVSCPPWDLSWISILKSRRIRVDRFGAVGLPHGLVRSRTSALAVNATATEVDGRFPRWLSGRRRERCPWVHGRF